MPASLSPVFRSSHFLHDPTGNDFHIIYPVLVTSGSIFNAKNLKPFQIGSFSPLPCGSEQRPAFVSHISGGEGLGAQHLPAWMHGTLSTAIAQAEYTHDFCHGLEVNVLHYIWAAKFQETRQSWTGSNLGCHSGSTQGSRTIVFFLFSYFSDSFCFYFTIFIYKGSVLVLRMAS